MPSVRKLAHNWPNLVAHNVHLLLICIFINILVFTLILSRAKSYAHARSWSRPQPAPEHAQWLYEYAPQQPCFHGWLQPHRPIFTGHTSSEPNEHDPGAAHGKLWASAKHEHAAKSRWNHSFVSLPLQMFFVCFCFFQFHIEIFVCKCGFLFSSTGPMMHQQPPSQQYNMPPGGTGQHYQGQQNPMGMMGQVNQGNHVMGQRPMPPYRPPQQGTPVGVSAACKL